MERYTVASDANNDYVSVDDLFGHLTRQSGEPGILLKGLRYREGLSQTEFAKTLNISQTNLSAWEMVDVLLGKELQSVLAIFSG